MWFGWRFSASVETWPVANVWRGMCGCAPGNLDAGAFGEPSQVAVCRSSGHCGW
jgi:hypothetical protein